MNEPVFDWGLGGGNGMLDKKTEAFLTAQIDQGGMCIRAFVKNNSAEEVLNVLGRLVDMNASKDPWQCLIGTLGAYALSVAIRDESSAGRGEGER